MQKSKLLLLKMSLTITEYCRNYLNITDSWRKIQSYHVGNTNIKCDRDNNLMDGSTWFRFLGAAGTMLQTSPNALSMQKKLPCKTHGVSWINGTHPMVSERIVTRSICYAYHGKESWSNIMTHDMNIAACVENDRDIFYVYQLKRPAHCSYAYCAE